MINLCLVVIATQFSETKKRETERMAVERARRRRGQSRSSSSVTSRTSVQAVSAAGGCCVDLIAYVDYLVHVARRRAARLVRLCRRRLCRRTPPTTAAVQPGAPLNVYAVTRANRRRRKPRRRGTPSGQRRRDARRRRPGKAPYASPELSDIDLLASPRRPQERPTTTTGGSSELCAGASTDLLPIRPSFPAAGN